MPFPGEGLLGFFGRVAPTGRSSRFGLSRHAALRLSPPSGSGAQRARRLRLSGEDAAAEAAFLALGEDPAGMAGLWELRASRGEADARLIDAAVAARPRSAWRAWRGLWSLAQGRKDAARDLGPAAEGRGDAAVLALAGLSREARKRRKHREEERLLAEAVRRAPQEGWLRRLQAKALWDAGDEEGFAAACEEEMLRDEGVATFAYAFGGSGTAPALLLARVERALKREPRSWWRRALRGDLRQSVARDTAAQDRAGSAADFEAAAAGASRPGWALAQLARALQGLGDGEGALKAADAAVRAEPRRGWIRAWRGELRRKLGDLDGAAPELEAALALDPAYEVAWASRGALRAARGEAAAAAADLRRALALEPGLEWARRELSSLL